MFNKIVAFFIPQEEYETEETLRKAKLTVSTFLLVAYFNLTYIVLAYLMDYKEAMLHQAGLMLIAFISLLLYKSNFNRNIIYFIFFISATISIAFSVYGTGGYESFIFPWLSSTPIVAMLVWGRRGSLISLVFVIIVSYWFYSIYHSGIRLPNLIRNVEYLQIYSFSCQIGITLILYLIAFVFENAKNTAMQQVNEARSQSDALLLNILPKEVADELKKSGKSHARNYEMATILFADIKDFTEISSNMSPAKLIEELEYIFGGFDAIIKKHNIEKIKVIGDAYMCVGGIPIPNTTNPVEVVRAAIEMQQFMRTMTEERKARNEQTYEIRIGINTGPIVAGIIGTKKFAYDVWGDAVNLASRLETYDIAGKINISNATFEAVKDYFSCEEREWTEVKGKGAIKMYFVQQ